MKRCQDCIHSKLGEQVKSGRYTNFFVHCTIKKEVVILDHWKKTEALNCDKFQEEVGIKYDLRNKNKIEAWYSKKTLETIIKSIDVHLGKYGKLEIEKEWTGERYPIAMIDQHGHSVNMIALYIISFENDFYRLAFKEFIG